MLKVKPCDYSDLIELDKSQGDPLDMASANERLYNTVFPGYNNVVRYIVVYSAMSWMALQVDRYLQESPRGSEDETEEVQLRAMQKMELVLLWLCGGDANLAGKSRSFPTSNKTVRLEFSEWDNKSSLMAAVNYGPSITNGLGFLDRNWICTEKGRALAEAFGKRLGNQARFRWLADVETQTSTATKIKDLRSVVDVLQPSPEEVRYFLQGFFPENLPADTDLRDQDRWRGLHLMLRSIELLELDDVPTEVSIRATMARGMTPSGRSVIRDGLEKIQAVWAVLQVRQLQRVASESLFAIVEAWIRRYDRSNKSIDCCVSALSTAVSEEMKRGRKIVSMEDMLDDVANARSSHPTFYAAAAAGQDGAADVFRYLREFARKTFHQKCGVADREAACFSLYALAFCGAEALNLRDREPHVQVLQDLEGERTSLSHLGRTLERFKDRAIQEWTEHILYDWIFSRYAEVAVQRGTPSAGKVRLDFSEGEFGLEFHAVRRAGFKPSLAKDKLMQSLILCEQCGLVSIKGDRFPVIALTAAGRMRVKNYAINLGSGA